MTQSSSSRRSVTTLRDPSSALRSDSYSIRSWERTSHGGRRSVRPKTAFFGRYSDWLELPRFTDGVDSVWFAYPMIVKEAAPFTRRDVQIFLEERNIQTRVVFTGNVTRQPGFKGIDARVDPMGLANADRVMERGFLIAAHHGMTKEMLEHLHESFEAFADQF